MGKPYKSELDNLAGTYDWSLKADIRTLLTGISTTVGMPLLAVGSGGSLTNAYLASTLHQNYAGVISKPYTPLAIMSSKNSLRGIAVMFISAGGSNPDIISAFKHVVVQEPAKIIVLCSRTQTPLAKLAAEYRYVEYIEFDLPSGKDGFLATNTLLAFSVLLVRAYLKLFGQGEDLPTTLSALISPGSTMDAFVHDLRALSQPLWGRESLIVLYGSDSEVAAVDLESKFSEAALKPVQLADYRNFAHGRHHWLAKRGQTTGVLALITKDDQDIAERTLKLLPEEVSIVRLASAAECTRASLALLAKVLYLVGQAGEALGIDPGRPGVPRFGSRIYNLRLRKPALSTRLSLPRAKSIAIERKAMERIEGIEAKGELPYWSEAYDRFVGRLASARFGAVVFDYDGTLCDRHERYDGMHEKTASQLVRILKSGILIGIATGRGKSVKNDFRRCIPSDLWEKVIIGYYNGSDLGMLGDDSHPYGGDDACSDLQPIINAFKSSNRLGSMAIFTQRKMQVTVEPKSPALFPQVWKLVEHIVHKTCVSGVTVQLSSHSIDILAPGVSKNNLVKALEGLLESMNGAPPILCIGDRGDWPGNDFDLLSGPFTLSVDQVSPDIDSCWNLAPAGYRGVQATVEYLKTFSVRGRSARILMRRLEGVVHER